MIDIDITVKIGGEAGQGIQTVGNLLASACCRIGLFIFGINDFESRIRGGHSFFQLRISSKKIHAPYHGVNLLVAIDQNTLALHKDQVVPKGMAIINDDKTGIKDGVLSVPISGIAKNAGGEIMANTVVFGAVLGLLKIPSDILQKTIEDHFANLSPDKIAENINAGVLGYKMTEDIDFFYALHWKIRKSRGTLSTGSRSMALGALAGDCRFAAFYPMSPATGIMETLASFQDRFPLVVEQAEDEIAAINMIIGSAYAGARSITATSGGGFCLMTEGLGLAGMTETPVVVINAQRPGPATGLPTRTAQGDLLFAIRAAQDDFPRFVFAPGSPEEAYDVTIRALNLSEKYQTVAIILVDQFLNDSLFLIDKKWVIPEKIERFLAEYHPDSGKNSYHRYALDDSGISPRVVPGTSGSLVVVSGNEHSEDGHISEVSHIRNSMVRKRQQKSRGMLSEMKKPSQYHGDAKILLVGWGSTEGILREAVDMLRKDGVMTGSVHFCDIWPFPVEFALDVLSKAHRLYSVEQNSTGQFAQLLRQETGLKVSGKILKYDGRPFFPYEIYREIKENGV